MENQNIIESSFVREYPHDSAERFIVISRLLAYPREALIQEAKEFLADATLNFCCDQVDQILPGAWIEVRKILSRISDEKGFLRALESRYIDLFDRGQCSLRETEFGKDRAFAKGNELADINGFYAAFGFGSKDGEESREMADHLAVEAEFYTLLVLKQEALIGDEEGSQVVYSARRKFLEHHFGRFVTAAASRPAVLEDEVYRVILAFAAAAVKFECQELNVDVLESTWERSIPEEDSVSCGATGAIDELVRLPTGSRQ